MSYPLVNGAAINSDEAQGTEGIDLVAAGRARASSVILAVGASALEVGSPAVFVRILPVGINMVRTGQALIQANQSARPAGIDLAAAGQARTRVRLLPNGAEPLELGSLRARIGTDIALRPVGMALVRTEYHAVSNAQPNPNVGLQARGAHPLELGAPALASASMLLQAAGASPLQIGAPGSKLSLSASGARPLELGGPVLGLRLNAAGARPMEVGTPGVVRFTIMVPGTDLVRSSAASLLQGGSALFAAGARPLEMGSPGMPSIALHARAAFPLEIGRPMMDRGSAC